MCSRELAQASGQGLPIRNTRSCPPSDAQTRTKTRSLLLGRDHPHGNLTAHPSLQGLLVPSLVILVTVWGGFTCVYRNPVTTPNSGDPTELSGTLWPRGSHGCPPSCLKMKCQATNRWGFFLLWPLSNPMVGDLLSCPITGWRGGCLPISSFPFAGVHPACEVACLHSVSRINLCLAPALHDLIITKIATLIKGTFLTSNQLWIAGVNESHFRNWEEVSLREVKPLAHDHKADTGRISLQTQVFLTPRAFYTPSRSTVFTCF